MKCPNCNFDIGEKDTICRGCGESVFNLKKSIENNTINTQKETTQINTNPSLPIVNENITNNQDLNYNSVSSTSELKNETLEEINLLNNSENGIKCPKCGAVIQHNWNFCPSCHCQLKDKIINEDIKYYPTSKEKRLIRLFLTCIFLPIVLVGLPCIFINLAQNPLDDYEPFFSLFMMLATFSPNLYIVALVLIIDGKNKYPKNKIINIIFKIYITLFILVVIFLAIAVPIFIVDCLESCKTMG